MKPNSMELIYKTVNVIASRKHDTQTEQRLADAIERELLAISSQAMLAPRNYPDTRAALETSCQ